MKTTPFAAIAYFIPEMRWILLERVTYSRNAREIYRCTMAGQGIIITLKLLPQEFHFTPPKALYNIKRRLIIIARFLMICPDIFGWGHAREAYRGIYFDALPRNETSEASYIANDISATNTRQSPYALAHYFPFASRHANTGYRRKTF